MKETRYYDPEYDRFVTEDTIRNQYNYFAQQEWFHKSYEQFKDENFCDAETSERMLKDRGEMEDTAMTNTTKEIKAMQFKHNEVIYYREKTGYCYAQPVGGIKKRIGKTAFETVYNEYVNTKVSDEEWQKQADTEKAQQEAAKKAQYEADEKAVLGDTPEATEEAQGQKTGGQPSGEKEAKKAPRKSKDVAFTFTPEDGGKQITLTAKQVDFIRHIPDTCFYENGLESTPWCDCLVDEIGGQFKGKAMTVGAMISTLREKGLIYVCTEKVNGRKAKYFGFTEIGKKIAKELGLQ